MFRENVRLPPMVRSHSQSTLDCCLFVHLWNGGQNVIQWVLIGFIYPFRLIYPTGWLFNFVCFLVIQPCWKFQSWCLNPCRILSQSQVLLVISCSFSPADAPATVHPWYFLFFHPPKKITDIYTVYIYIYIIKYMYIYIYRYVYQKSEVF